MEKQILDEVINSASINQNHFFILYGFFSYLFFALRDLLQEKKVLFLVTENKSVCQHFFFHAKFFKLYPPDSANDLKKRRIVLTRWLQETKINQLSQYRRLAHMINTSNTEQY